VKITVTEQNLVEHFPALDALGVCHSAFIKRVPGIAVESEKAEALTQLEAVHATVREELGLAALPLVTAEQVHGNNIAVIDQPLSADKTFAGCDGFITNQRGVLLGIYVADCCAVYIVDPRASAIGLVHSGKKGTELAIAGLAIDQMQTHFGSDPADLVVQLAPASVRHITKSILPRKLLSNVGLAASNTFMTAGFVLRAI
jgi:copper oxidase (laccase) domain-containing protein